MRKLTFILTSFIVLLSFLPKELMSIPAFARKHKLSCKTCHDPFPHLKAFGDEFAGNGFTIDGKVPSRYNKETGDDKLSLMRSIPMAIRMDFFMTENKSNGNVTDFSVPFNIKFLSGGVLSKNVSYYFYFFLSERGKVVGLEDAFIMFNDVLGSGASVALGQFQISDPLFKRELRLTYEDYKIYKASPGLSHLDLTYDRGIMISYTVPRGGPDLVLEVLNGTGIEEADNLRNFDNDSYKNVFGRISQDVGKHFRIGGSAFFGKESADGFSNRVSMYGADFTFTLYPFEVNFQYISRTDDNADLIASSPGDIKTSGGLVECIYTFGGVDSPWYAVGLYNWVNSEDDLNDYESVTFHAGYLLKRNIRLITEVGYILKSINGEHLRALVGIVTAF